MPLTEQPTPILDTVRAWSLVVAMRQRLREHGPFRRSIGVLLDSTGRLVEVEPAHGWIVIDPQAERGWSWPDRGFTTTAAHVHALGQLFDLYVPLCVGPQAEHLVLAHLAQSLDGRIATASGVSQFISGHEELVHTHRLRALFDAVLVGASTVEHDDPRLTTRLCSGSNPVRVIVDPGGRVDPRSRVMRDGESPTLLVRRGDGPSVTSGRAGHVEVITVPSEGAWIPVDGILELLRARGLRRIFIEGGGVTVSRFLEAGQLDRLQVSVSPVIIGSGRPGFTLPEAIDLRAAIALEARAFAIGRDTLFDCCLPRQ